MSSKFYRTGSESSESESTSPPKPDATSTDSSSPPKPVTESTETSPPEPAAKSTATSPLKLAPKSVESSLSKSTPKSGSGAKSRYITDFEEIDELGRGAYGQVFLCKHRLDCRSYAIKQIPFNEDEKETILREVYALSLLYHKNIVRYHQAWEEISRKQNTKDGRSLSGASKGKESCLFIQVEYCPRTLDKEIGLGKEDIDKAKAWGYFRQLVEALSYIHANGVIHRDLCPQNILLDNLMRVKISDFGLAKIFEGDQPEPLCASDDLLGHDCYRAPEMYQKGSEINPKVDMYSLGIILFELFYPFRTVMERGKVLRDLIEHGKFPAPTSKPFHYPEDLILELLSKDPNGRPSAQQILEKSPWRVDELLSQEPAADIEGLGANVEPTEIEGLCANPEPAHIEGLGANLVPADDREGVGPNSELAADIEGLGPNTEPAADIEGLGANPEPARIEDKILEVDA